MAVCILADYHNEFQDSFLYREHYSDPNIIVPPSESIFLAKSYPRPVSLLQPSLTTLALPTRCSFDVCAWRQSRLNC